MSLADLLLIKRFLWAIIIADAIIIVIGIIALIAILWWMDLEDEHSNRV